MEKRVLRKKGKNKRKKTKEQCVFLKKVYSFYRPNFPVCHSERPEGAKNLIPHYNKILNIISG